MDNPIEIDNSWPDVQLRGDKISAYGVSEETLAELVRKYVAELLGTPEPVVQNLIVADIGDYGDAIRGELKEPVERTHTEGLFYTGVGKTIPFYDENDDCIGNTIVVASGVVASALNDAKTLEPFLPPALGRYVLHHELAHCVDHFMRRRVADQSISEAGEFSIQRVGQFFKRIVMEEFAACLISGRTLDDEAYEMLTHLDQMPLEEMLQETARMRFEFRSHQSSDLIKLAFESSQCIWMIIMQLAKIFGSTVGSARACASFGLPSSIASNESAITEVKKLGSLFGDAARNYPNWPINGWTDLDQIWSRLAELHGFRFEQGDECDMLWLDDGYDPIK